MKQGSLSIIYFILGFDSQEITTHIFSHAFHVLWGAVHTEKIRISIYHMSPAVYYNVQSSCFS